MDGSINEWNSPCRGVWRCILAANACYEMIIVKAKNPDILSGNDKAYVYFSGVFTDTDTGETFYERECLSGPEPTNVLDCLKIAYADYAQNVTKEVVLKEEQTDGMHEEKS